ncbi:hypothetical protein [Nonomuraea sp. NPDC050202]|uniref:hypothetical protein n=1 Tax=Nonomuraea sp. NPDC050202 TaxID=3155035 RepID=UPI0033EC0842
MTDPTTTDPIEPGVTYVRSLVWPGHVGTVTDIFDDGDLPVAWHHTFVNDQVSPTEVEVLSQEEKAAYIAAQPPGYDKGYSTVHLPEENA